MFYYVMFRKYIALCILFFMTQQAFGFDQPALLVHKNLGENSTFPCVPAAALLTLRLYGVEESSESLLSECTVSPEGDVPMSDFKSICTSRGLFVYAYRDPSINQLKQWLADGFVVVAVPHNQSNRHHALCLYGSNFLVADNLSPVHTVDMRKLELRIADGMPCFVVGQGLLGLFYLYLNQVLSTTALLALIVAVYLFLIFFRTRRQQARDRDLIK